MLYHCWSWLICEGFPFLDVVLVDKSKMLRISDKLRLNINPLIGSTICAKKCWSYRKCCATNTIKTLHWIHWQGKNVFTGTPSKRHSGCFAKSTLVPNTSRDFLQEQNYFQQQTNAFAVLPFGGENNLDLDCKELTVICQFMLLAAFAWCDC